MPTKQETFNTICSFLIAQGCKSTSVAFGCSYRGDEGRKCAAGVLIPDNKYDPSMEGGRVAPGYDKLVSHGNTWKTKTKAISKVIDEEGHDLHLVSELQEAHDYICKVNFVEHFKEAAKNVANNHGLNCDVLA